VLVRWALLAAATLHLLFSGTVVHPLPGWSAVTLGVLWNALSVYRRKQGPTGLWWCILAQLVDSVVLVGYMASLQGGVARHLPLYTSMLIVATIRFGQWGAVASAAFGVVLVVATILGTPQPWAEPTSAVSIGIVLADAILLGYLAYLVRCQQIRHQERETDLQQSVSEITVLHEVSSAAHDLRSEDALQGHCRDCDRLYGVPTRGTLFDGQGGWDDPASLSQLPASVSAIEPAATLDGACALEGCLAAQAPDCHRRLAGAARDECRGLSTDRRSTAWRCWTDRVLVADSNDRRETFRNDMQMLSNLAKSAVVAIENASLHRQVARMANYDGVTDLYNHRYFQERLREMLRLSEEHEPVSLLMVEIDKFKRYNDTFGHRQGDTALYSLSRALEQSTQQLDGLVARYGGDEFVVILPAVGPENALRVAQQIKDQVYEIVTELLARQNLPPVMLSIGVATYPVDGQDAPALIEAADQAMYVVKHSGGNRVHKYSHT
jgi:diguanylate cyclase (GGDEF)-like protein